MPGGRYGVGLDWTYEFVVAQRGGEDLLLDGESLRLGPSGRIRHGQWLFGAELPLLFTGGGSLDGLIENWHDWFGLPNGGREQRPRGKYAYRYNDNGIGVLDDEHGHSGIGDMRLSAARCRSEEHTSELQSLMRISYAVFCLKKKNT